MTQFTLPCIPPHNVSLLESLIQPLLSSSVYTWHHSIHIQTYSPFPLICVSLNGSMSNLRSTVILSIYVHLPASILHSCILYIVLFMSLSPFFLHVTKLLQFTIALHNSLFLYCSCQTIYIYSNFSHCLQLMPVNNLFYLNFSLILAFIPDLTLTLECHYCIYCIPMLTVLSFILIITTQNMIKKEYLKIKSVILWPNKGKCNNACNSIIYF